MVHPQQQQQHHHIALAPASFQAIAASQPHVVYYHQSPEVEEGRVVAGPRPIYATYDMNFSSEVRKEGTSEAHQMQFLQPTATMPVKKTEQLVPKMMMPQFAYPRKRAHGEPEAPKYMTVIPGGDLASPPTSHPIYGNHPLVVGVPVVLDHDANKRYAKAPVQGPKRQKTSTPLDARTIPYLGKSKVSRLASLGVLTVEDLAHVNPDDRLFAVAATKNNRSDHAKRTLQKWRDKAINYLMTKEQQ